MGYTDSRARMTLGLGASSISDCGYGFAQNVKGIEEYQHLVGEGVLPIYRGHLLTDEDREIRSHILDLMCRFETSFGEDMEVLPEKDAILQRLEPMFGDGLISLSGQKLTVMPKGRPFIRNICMAFDVLLHRKAPDTKLFSMTI